MKKSYYLLLITLLLSLASCVTNKENYLSSFEKFVQEVEEKKTITEDEMNTLNAKFKDFSQEYYNKFKDTMSQEEIKETAKLEARYYKALARCGFNDVKDKIKKAASAIEEIFNN